MADATKDQLRHLLRRAHAEQLADVAATEIALNYSRTRYFEIENRITEARLARLEEPPSYAEQLFYIALGGALGPLAQYAMSSVMRKLLVNHLVFVETFVEGRIRSAADREKIRKFLKIGKGLTVTRISEPVQHFANPNTMWGRIYRFVPEYIGSRFDEIVQLGPPKAQRSFPVTSTVAEFLLVQEGWAAAQRLTLDTEYGEYEDLVDDGELKLVQDALQKRIELGSVTPNSAAPLKLETETLAQELSQKARAMGEGFLLQLAVQRYGPPGKLGEIRTAGVPTKYLPSGKAVYQSAAVKQDAELILKVLVKELIDPSADPPMTFYDFAFRNTRSSDSPAVEHVVFDSAYVSLIKVFWHVQMSLLGSELAKSLPSAESIFGRVFGGD